MRRSTLLGTIVPLLGSLLVQHADAAELIPVEPRCEYLVDPIGLDTVRPRLSWKLKSDGNEQQAITQSGYKILVASTAQQLQSDEGDLWDSGKVESPASLHQVYGGKQLSCGKLCWWKVRVWNDKGNRSS